MKKGTRMSRGFRLKMREAAFKRDNTNRIAALPKGKKHWNHTDKPSVLTMHRRVHRAHGPAKNHPCASQCGRTALDWALKEGRAYSDSVDDYNPLCRKCHIAQDKHWSKVDRSRHIIVRDKKGRITNTLVT